VNSATAALEFALRIAGVGRGDEVITTSLSWVATANVILAVGATPVFVDIDPITRLIDLELIESAITSKTRAIIPVDLAGLPVDRDRLYEIAWSHGLRVIEDAAQSQGANWHGVEIGAAGDLVAMSFHPNKNMTTGEGGCLVMHDEAEAQLFEKLRLQGVTRDADGTYDCDLLGGKANLTDIGAAIGLGQLHHLDENNQRRAELAGLYFQRLALTDFILPPADFEKSNWHMFQITLPLTRLQRSRGDMMTTLKERGIGTGVHYPIITGFELYRKLGYRPESTPIAAEIGRSILTLPLFPTMSSHDIDRVVEALTQVLN
jgi:dTDP-4-amino-4,6-dideoxygalactose transaminase